MNKKLLLIVTLITTMNNYVKTENKFDPETCNRMDVHLVAFKNENCSPIDWEKIWNQMVALLENVKTVEGMKGEMSIFAFDTNENTTKDKKEFKPAACDIISMNVMATKEECSLQAWEEVYECITILKENIENTKGIKSGIYVMTSNQKEGNLSKENLP